VKPSFEPEQDSSRDAETFAMLAKARAALLDYLPKDAILARFQRGAGEELVSGKFASPESSAALVANAFGFFLEQPALLLLPAHLMPVGSALAVLLEEEVRFGWRGGFHPWLDVVVETGERFIGIESKRYEPFRDKKKVDFSSAFERDVWGKKMGQFGAMRKALSSGRKHGLPAQSRFVASHGRSDRPLSKLQGNRPRRRSVAPDRQRNEHHCPKSQT
jgi:hypothetical protein